MASFNVHVVVNILENLANSSQVDTQKVDETIDALERLKSTINIEDDEAIDKVDEIQDYLEFLLAEESSTDKAKEELHKIINELQA
ncbi:MAG: hypothetical protein LLG02_01830 [Pelosinus sp.]|nr:hypothetical protein [Pelosinus sp.]